ncbi:acyl-CoA oxidase [Atractiella rhizophila]|nr:acyl-CoA oxidase [Atractiella rhizophila]
MSEPLAPLRTRAFSDALTSFLNPVGSRSSYDPSQFPKLEKLRNERGYLSRKERLILGLEAQRELIANGRVYDLVPLLDEPTGLQLHMTAYLPTLMSQSSDEQREKWLPPAIACVHLGCYAQTELGHGSNVAGLETTATFDKGTDEWVLHSPKASSVKFWIGALGLIATHCIIQAQLVLDGKSHGPHLFHFQLRDLETHLPLKGIEIGEIGPKVMGGMASVDNGWMKLTHHRIPRESLLSRYSHVTREGKYVSPPRGLSKMSYSGMLYIRSQMISGLSLTLKKAATIGIRYTAQRRQFSADNVNGEGRDGGEESRVLEYQSVYLRVGGVLADAVVFGIAGRRMLTLYNALTEQLSSDPVPSTAATLLAETHLAASSLKPYVTSRVISGIETCRRACGGHGYLDSNGLGRLYANTLPSATYEGENYVLMNQVVRGAVKSVDTTPKAKARLELLDVPSWIQHARRLAAARASAWTVKIAGLLNSGKKSTEVGWYGEKVANAVSENWIIDQVLTLIQHKNDDGTESLDGADWEALETIIHFWILKTYETAISDLLEFDLITPPSVSALRQGVDDLGRKIASFSIPFTDALGFSDRELESTLGKYDGFAYEEIMKNIRDKEIWNLGSVAEKLDIIKKYVIPLRATGVQNARIQSSGLSKL